MGGTEFFILVCISIMLSPVPIREPKSRTIQSIHTPSGCPEEKGLPDSGSISLKFGSNLSTLCLSPNVIALANFLDGLSLTYFYTSFS